jgi:hypothetical protein
MATSSVFFRFAFAAVVCGGGTLAHATNIDVHAGIDHRQRTEFIANDFRPDTPASSAGWFARTLASWTVDVDAAQFFVEAIDSRALLVDAPPSTSHIDPIDLLQARARLTLRDVVAANDALRIDAGRMTLDVGSRRFVARNDFRNTISAFTGVDVTWTRDDVEVRTFAVTPVRRLPDDPARLAGHVVVFDVESGAALGGVQVTWSRATERLAFEVGALALDESVVDGGTAVAGGPVRRLVTPVVRLLRRPAAGAFDLQVEVAPQFGVVTPVDGEAIERRALSLHGSLGYRAPLPWSPRLVVAWDHASGDDDPDDDPDDDVNGRFDPLFGARRFELGPTGLFGPFARSNLDSAALRLELAPADGVDVLVGVRHAALASARDAWTTTNVRDKTGGAGTELGNLLETRVRLPIVAGVVGLDVGGAALLPGRFSRGNIDAAGEPTVFAYAALSAQLGGR